MSILSFSVISFIFILEIIVAFGLLKSYKEIRQTANKNRDENLRAVDEIKDLKLKCSELESEYTKKIEDLIKEKADFELEKEETEKEVIEELQETITVIDAQLKEKIRAIQETNTVVFECPCKHNSIPVEIDLSKEENTYICPECKNEYVVNITMIPVLRGKIVQEQNLYSLLASKMEGHNTFSELN